MQASHLIMKRRKILTLFQSSLLGIPPDVLVDSLFGDWELEGCHGNGNPFSESERKCQVSSLASQHWVCFPHVAERIVLSSSVPTPAHWGMVHASICIKQCSSQGWEWQHSTSQGRKAEFWEFGLSIVWKTFFWRVCYILLRGNSLTLQLIIIGLEQRHLINIHWM